MQRGVVVGDAGHSKACFLICCTRLQEPVSRLPVLPEVHVVNEIANHQAVTALAA